MVLSLLTSFRGGYLSQSSSPYGGLVSQGQQLRTHNRTHLPRFIPVLSPTRRLDRVIHAVQLVQFQGHHYVKLVQLGLSQTEKEVRYERFACGVD